ncbi:MAG: DUF1446 domain-containing protein, partial [Planctomycetales bacterium]
MTLRIANAAGFWGDWTAAPRRLLETAEVDFLTLEYLAELTMSILARQRKRDPLVGYASDFLSVVEDIAGLLRSQTQLHVVTNAGGLNPQACAARVAEIISAEGLGDVPIGVVSGDDLLGNIDDLV